MNTYLTDLGFTVVADLQVDRDSDQAPATYDPAPSYVNAATAQLHGYGRGPFCSFRIDPRFSGSGIYFLTVEGALRYVGSCDNLAKRINDGYGNISPRDCYEGGQQTNCRVNKLVLMEVRQWRSVRLWFVEVASPSECRRLESTIIDQQAPAWNLTR